MWSHVDFVDDHRHGLDWQFDRAQLPSIKSNRRLPAESSDVNFWAFDQVWPKYTKNKKTLFSCSIHFFSVKKYFNKFHYLHFSNGMSLWLRKKLFIRFFSYKEKMRLKSSRSYSTASGTNWYSVAQQARFISIPSNRRESPQSRRSRHCSDICQVSTHLSRLARDPHKPKPSSSLLDTLLIITSYYRTIVSCSFVNQRESFNQKFA